jgi:hypothetical protein
LKIIGHGNPDNNLESHCILKLEDTRARKKDSVAYQLSTFPRDENSFIHIYIYLGNKLVVLEGIETYTGGSAATGRVSHAEQGKW